MDLSINTKKIYQILYHADQNLFFELQYGFMSGRSTTLQRLHVLDDCILKIDQGGTVQCIFLEFMEAMDFVPYKILLLELKSYGIDGKLLGWIERCLSTGSSEWS